MRQFKHAMAIRTFRLLLTVPDDTDEDRANGFADAVLAVLLDPISGDGTEISLSLADEGDVVIRVALDAFVVEDSETYEIK